MFNWIFAMVVDPQHSANVYAAAEEAGSFGDRAVFYRSTDAGQNWSTTQLPAFPDAYSMLAIDAVSTNVLYLTLKSRIYKSVDAGLTWVVVPIGVGVGGISTDPTTAGVVYAQNDDFIYRSSDFGASWTSSRPDLGFSFTQGWFFSGLNAITVDPRDSNTLYAPMEAGECDFLNVGHECGIFKSTDRGATWRELSVQGWFKNVAIDGRTGSLYAGSGYVLKSTDAGGTWTQINNGFTVGRFLAAVVLDPNNSSILYAVGEFPYSDGINRSTDGGASWTYVRVGTPNSSVMSFAVAAR